MSPILYMTEASPPARAVMMLADILGLKLELRDLNPVLREQDTPELTKKNPMRTVPILDEGDYCLADSHAINLYLLDTYGGAQHKHLYPTDKRMRAKINERLFFDCGILFPRLRAVMAPTYSGKLSELSKHMITNIDDAYRTLEAYLCEAKFLAGDTMTVADVNVVATVTSIDGLHPVDGDRFPKLKRWMAIMCDQDFCKRNNENGCDQFVTVLKKLMENNGQLAKSRL